MSAVKHDYYALLGISRDADAATIRRAFRAAVRALDSAASDSPDAEDRIGELKEAYAVLARPESRLLYDRYGHRGPVTGVDDAHWEARERSARGEDVTQELVLRWFETPEGTSRLVTFEAAETCPGCDGSGNATEPDPNCPACGGTGRYLLRSNSDAGAVEIEACPVCTPEPCEHCAGSGRVPAQRRLRVEVPPGLEDGDLLRVAGEGNAAPHAGVPGDLLLDVTVTPQPRESRLIRYLALLLFVAAAVVLYVYLH